MSLISKNNSQNKILEGHIRDIITSSEYETGISEFLSPLEQRIAYDVAYSVGAAQRCFFWGGVPEAQRKRCVIIPDWMTADGVLFSSPFDNERELFIREIASSGADDGKINESCVSLEFSSSVYAELEHRDYLGAILSLGLERGTVGDIAVLGKHSAVAFVSPEAAKLIISNMERVKNDTVQIRPFEAEPSFRIPCEYKALTDTVMSARLDGIVKALCKISRDDAASLVEKGDVTLNYLTETKADKIIVKGDILSIRGYGKFVYDGDRGVNRRGRLRIDARKYV